MGRQNRDPRTQEKESLAVWNTAALWVTTRGWTTRNFGHGAGVGAVLHLYLSESKEENFVFVGNVNFGSCSGCSADAVQEV